MYVVVRQAGGRPFLARRGMGDANCPSLQQLMGVADPSDPCQGGAPACVPGAIDPSTGDTIVSCGSPAAAGVPVCPTGVRVSGTCVCPTGYYLDPASVMCVPNSAVGGGILSSFETYKPLIYTGAAVLVGFALLKAITK